MTCRPIKNQEPRLILERKPLPSLNTPPVGAPGAPASAARIERAGVAPASEGTTDAYICDEADLASVYKKGGIFSPPASTSRLFSQVIAAPTAGAIYRAPTMLAIGGIAPLSPFSTLPPPPESPISRLLYEILTQLKNFELTADLKVPVKNRDWAKTVHTHTQIVLGEHGRLDAARIKFDPYWGPLTFPGKAADVVREIPIIGIFAIYRLLSVEMDPVSRKIVGKGKYLFFPIERELQSTIVEKGEIPKDLVRRPGYDLYQGVPRYTWQLTDIVEQILAREKTEGFKEIGKATKLDTIVPLFDKGQVKIEGDFGNEEIKIGAVVLKFFPKKGKDPHRILIEGGLGEPKMKVWGLKSIEVTHSQGTLRLGNLEAAQGPLEFSWNLNFQDLKASRLHLPRLESKEFLIENISSNPEKNLTLRLRKGLTVKNLQLSMETGTPHLHVQEVEARQGEIEGMGVRFKTSPADKAVLRQIHLEMKKGFPHFHARLEGEASGELEYTKNGEEVAWLKIKDLKGQGTVRIGLDEKNRAYFGLSGDFSTQIPSLRLLVRSQKMKGLVRTEIGDAFVKGRASLTVWPEEVSASLKKLKNAPPLTVRGTSGRVSFQQDTSQVKEWPELTANLGPLASKIQTDLKIDLKDIGFEIHQMDVKRVVQTKGETPALEILEANISDIRIQGDLFGRLWGRLPGGIFHPIIIPEAAKMLDASVKIGGLRDFEEDGKRKVIFQKIFLSGEESKPTMTPRDQKRCGFDRQHIHADLGLFGFNPDSKEFQIQNLGKHFHIYLKNPPYLGGCLKID